ncbi:hypothetical protein C5748_14780 [Phyllobacterium phragmitis]|uniref:Uncharacterized protein n=1 Tax=Phyllobacterium phragmitis TaxID=2670329 RepID=A0A2S9IQ83_9HYPH|nr:hypothetical protein [Phyllobacterium phragmitis]PRD42687.1 hypothetical protein C5748_14780 [Phyllobacterium phragmitis]
MRSTQYSQTRESIIAAHMSEVIRDLRLVDVADYIAFIRYELFANIADIVNSATELHYFPQTLQFGHGGEYELDWDRHPRIILDMEFRNMGVYAYFRVLIDAEGSQIDLNHITFDQASKSPTHNTERLALAFEDARIPGSPRQATG